MIYAIIGALMIGLSLGVFGSGGSILTVPVLLYLLHHEDKVSIAESLGIVGAIALISAIPYALARLVEWRTVILFGVPGMVGTYLVLRCTPNGTDWVFPLHVPCHRLSWVRSAESA